MSEPEKKPAISLTAVPTFHLVAIGFGLAALATWYAWHEHPHNVFLRSWGPNVGTDLGSVAVALTLIEWIRKRQAREQLDPLLGPVLGHINGEFQIFIQAVAEDYATTHNATFKPLPTDPLELLDFWLTEQDAADLPHIGLEPDGQTLRDVGYEFARQVAWHEEQLGAAMEPALRAALRDFGRTVRLADTAVEADHVRQVAEMPPEIAALLNPERTSYRTFVSHACYLVEVMRVYRPSPVLLAVDPEVIAWAENNRRLRLVDLGEGHSEEPETVTRTVPQRDK